MSLSQFIQITISAEQAIEQKRQQLANLNMFEPYTVFRRLDQPRLGAVKQEELADFLTDNKQYFDNFQIEFLLQYLDFDKNGVITHDDLKNTILPRQNQALLDQCINRQQYEIPVEMLLPNDLEKCLSELFALIVQYFNEIQKLTLNDINLNEVNIYEQDESITVNSLSAWFQAQNISIEEKGLPIFIGLIDQDGTGRGTQQGLQTLIDQFARLQQQAEGNQNDEDQQYEEEQDQEIIIVDESQEQQQQKQQKQQQNQQQQQQQQQQYQQQQQKQYQKGQQQQIDELENENEQSYDQNEEQNEKHKQRQEQQFNGNENLSKPENQYQNNGGKIINSSQTYPLHRSYITPNFNNFRSPLLDYYEEQIRIEREKIIKLEIQLGIYSYYPRLQPSNLLCDFYEQLIVKELDKIQRITRELSISPNRIRERFSYHYDFDLKYSLELRLIEREIQIEQENQRRLNNYFDIDQRFVHSKISHLDNFAKINKRSYDNLDFESPLKKGQSMQHSYAQTLTPEKQLQVYGRTNQYDVQKKQQLYYQGIHQKY